MLHRPFRFKPSGDNFCLRVVMPKRTQIEAYKKIEKAKDLEREVKDKRSGKRANKQKEKRRNRHYSKTILRHLTDYLDKA